MIDSACQCRGGSGLRLQPSERSSFVLCQCRLRPDSVRPGTAAANLKQPARLGRGPDPSDPAAARRVGPARGHSD